MEIDWKKKYNEALERARALREEAIEKEYVNDYVKDYEAIFPELAESEDERIRKELIEFLREAYSRGNAPEKCAKWLVWLDWSKEQKESLTPTESYMKGFSDGVEAQMAEEQKQGWSKEDEAIYDSIIREIVDKDMAMTNLQKHWLRSLKNRGNSPKSNTNSPNEWNVNDESAFGDLMWCIEQARKSATVDDMGNVWYAEKWLKNRLKSLRPQPSWKPSEEQMGIFGRIVNDLKIKMVGVTVKEHHTLESLYNDIKKLM